MSDLLSLLVLFLGGALAYAFRYRLMAPFKRFDARNAARRAEEFRALTDRNAHYRQTVKAAEEQVEAVAKVTVADERTGEPLDRYLFLGTQYATHEEAEAARHAAVIEKAREFYIDLDRIFLSRGRWRDPPGSLPQLADPSKHETHTPPRS